MLSHRSCGKRHLNHNLHIKFLLPFSRLIPAPQCFSCREGPRTQDLRWPFSDEYMRTMTVPVLLATLLLIHARMPLAFLNSLALCWFTFSCFWRVPQAHETSAEQSVLLFIFPLEILSCFSKVYFHFDVSTCIYDISKPLKFASMTL